MSAVMSAWHFAAGSINGLCAGSPASFCRSSHQRSSSPSVSSCSAAAACSSAVRPAPSGLSSWTCSFSRWSICMWPARAPTASGDGFGLRLGLWLPPEASAPAQNSSPATRPVARIAPATPLDPVRQAAASAVSPPASSMRSSAASSSAVPAARAASSNTSATRGARFACLAARTWNADRPAESTARWSCIAHGLCSLASPASSSCTASTLSSSTASSSGVRPFWRSVMSTASFGASSDDRGSHRPDASVRSSPAYRANSSLSQALSAECSGVRPCASCFIVSLDSSGKRASRLRVRSGASSRGEEATTRCSMVRPLRSVWSAFRSGRAEASSRSTMSSRPTLAASVRAV
mmetsp:Transcript_10564/g.26843  ORF Transcript_10564/g.26843 Transcript_10564/m.26843 type:complete len:350 (-) Transcript_10564:186-1235(-)